jgi:DNA modification methylase
MNKRIGPISKNKPSKRARMGRLVDCSESLVIPYKDNGTRYPTQLIKINREPLDSLVHPTQKPGALLEYLVKTYTNPGDTILDCTMGSCSTGKAAVKNGRSFIGIDNGYCEKENSEYYGWSWVDYAHVALANIAGDFIRTPAEKATGQMSLLLEAG